MDNDNNILGGFDAIFDQFAPNAGIKQPETSADDVDKDPVDIDELDTSKLDNHSDEPEPEITDSTAGSDGSADSAPDVPASSDSESNEIVSTFFDAIAESIGWDDVDDDEKPKSVEDLVEYMKSAVEAGSVPKYANDEVAKLDEFVRNGGNIADYIEAVSDDYDDSVIDNVDGQRSVVAEFLAAKGFSDAQIQRKLNKYEDAEILEDEAKDALESLKELKANNTEALLEAQKIAKQTAEKEQQNFYTGVVSEIEALTHVRDIKIPEKDKKDLVDYIFKVESDGRTKYQKDYVSSSKNLIESAYFTMKGDSLISQAKKKGESTAVDKFKRALASNKVGSSKQHINDGSATPLWALASKQLVK
jgi:hypothetical protein